MRQWLFRSAKYCSLTGPDEAWLDFVAANRQGTYQGEKYDLIYGAVANDDVYRTIALYMTGVLDKNRHYLLSKYASCLTNWYLQQKNPCNI